MTTFDPKAFSVFGFPGDDTGDAPTFAAYSPSQDDARRDVATYRVDRPEIRIWQIVNNADDATETLFTRTPQ